MEADAHSTNFAENKNFFLNANNPTSFERTWKNINFIYHQAGLIKDGVAFNQVMDFSIIKAFEKEGMFKDQKDQFVSKFVPTTYKKINAEAPIITQTVRINFYPNSANIYEPAHNLTGKPIPNTLYDPNVEATMDKVAMLVGAYDRAVVAIVGHTDSSMQGRVPESIVKQLSKERAQAVKQALIDKYKFSPKKFVVEGSGWDKPADPSNPKDQAANRRVEVSVYPPEQ